MITSTLTRFDFATPARDQKALGQQPASALAKGFTIVFRATFGQVNRRELLLEVAGTVEAYVRMAGTDPTEAAFDRQAQNYLSFPEPGGACPVLEARLLLNSAEHPEWRQARIGFPLSRMRDRQAEHLIVLHYTGVLWQIFNNGELMDEELPVGDAACQGSSSLRIASGRVRQADVYAPALTPVVSGSATTETRGIQYYTPRGHNAWPGDTACFFHDGRYHLFYLHDRRHHNSRFGMGAHSFAHLSSTDLVNWTDHDRAVGIEAQWESIGTGTPFFHKGKYYLAYGLHTTRVVPYEKTALPILQKYQNEHGNSGMFRAADLDAAPAGGTYAVSDDGIRFTKSGVLMHLCENPSVFSRPDGSLLLLTDTGTWVSKELGNWTCVDPSFPPIGRASFIRNTAECPCYFEWNGFHYVMCGFSGFWSSRTGAPGSYIDQAALGTDIYEGLGVPMVAGFTGNRRIMAGWLTGGGWAICLVLRELIQHADGKLGLKWPAEAIPATATPVSLAPSIRFDGSKDGGVRFADLPSDSFLLSMTVEPAPGGGAFAIRFSGADGEEPCGCELQLRVSQGRAQWGNATDGTFAAPIPTTREIVDVEQNEISCTKEVKNVNIHFRSRNFCIEHVAGMDRPFSLKVIVRRDNKMSATIIDAEIAGQRTMITYRPGLTVRRLVLAASEPGTRVTALTLATLEPASDD